MKTFMSEPMSPIHFQDMKHAFADPEGAGARRRD